MNRITVPTALSCLCFFGLCFSLEPLSISAQSTLSGQLGSRTLDKSTINKFSGELKASINTKNSISIKEFSMDNDFKIIILTMDAHDHKHGVGGENQVGVGSDHQHPVGGNTTGPYPPSNPHTTRTPSKPICKETGKEKCECKETCPCPFCVDKAPKTIR